MAFPYAFTKGFETNSLTSEFSTSADSNSKMAIRHYGYMARHHNVVPYRGAYALHIDLSGGTADAYVQENDGFDLSADASWSFRMYFLVKDLTIGTDERFTIFTMQSAGPADDMTIGIYESSGTVYFIAGETGSEATKIATKPVVENVWHCLELTGELDAGGGNDGSFTFYLDGYQVGSQQTSLNQAAIIQARVGSIGIDAGTTAGHLFFDEITFDNDASTQIKPHRERFPSHMYTLIHNDHVMIGRGCIDLELTAESTDAEAYVYDTDDANSAYASDPIAVLRNTAEVEVTESTDIEFTRGCYVTLAGTTPRAIATIKDGVTMSEGGRKNYGLARL